VTQREIAEQACHIEMDLLGEPIGKQDQYIATFAALRVHVSTRRTRGCRAAAASTATLHRLEDGLAMFFTGYTRNASEILKDQDVRSKQKDKDMIENMHFVKKLGTRAKPRWKPAICGFRRIDARTLGAEAGAQQRNEQSRDRRVL